MGFSPKTLVAFCWTVLFIISFVHCLPMTHGGKPGNCLLLFIPSLL